MDTVDLALRRYDAVLRYLAYENTVYWTRSSFFLAANAGLFGFIATKMPFSSRDIQGVQGIVLAVGCMAGFMLSILWGRALTSGEFWISRWENICLSLEPEALGEIEMWRNCRRAGQDRAKKVAHHTARLFSTLWIVAFCYVTLLSLLRYCHAP